MRPCLGFAYIPSRWRGIPVSGHSRTDNHSNRRYCRDGYGCQPRGHRCAGGLLSTASLRQIQTRTDDAASNSQGNRSRAISSLFEDNMKAVGRTIIVASISLLVFTSVAFSFQALHLRRKIAAAHRGHESATPASERSLVWGVHPDMN